MSYNQRIYRKLSLCGIHNNMKGTVVAQAMVSQPRRRFQLRGLRQHQEHVFKCFGVEVGELRQAAAREGAAPLIAAELAREVG